MDWEQIALRWGANILAAAGIVVAAYFVIAILQKLLDAALRKTKLSGIIVTFLISAATKIAWALAIMMALDKLGVDVGPLVAGLGVTGFIVGFAFQDTMGNFAAGLMIALNRPFEMGDFVRLGADEGTVIELNMMAITLATPDNKKLVIPNKVAWGSTIVNFNALKIRRVDMKVGVAYGTDLAKARETALSVAAGLPGVLAEKPPVAEVASLDDSAVTLTIRVWVNAADYWKCYWAGLPAIKTAFDAAGISIPFPQLDVHLDK